MDFSAGALPIGVKFCTALRPHLGQVFSHFWGDNPRDGQILGVNRVWRCMLLGEAVWRYMLLGEALVYLFFTSDALLMSELTKRHAGNVRLKAELDQFLQTFDRLHRGQKCTLVTQFSIPHIAFMSPSFRTAAICLKSKATI